MKFRNFVLFLFLIYETFFYLVTGKTNEEKNDCTKFFNFMLKDNKDYSSEDCCLKQGIRIHCEDGYITIINL